MSKSSVKLSSLFVVTLGALFADAEQNRIFQFEKGESSYEMRNQVQNHIFSDSSTKNGVNSKKNLRSYAFVQAGLEEVDSVDISPSPNKDDNECLLSTINFQPEMIPPIVITNYPIKHSIFGYYYFYTSSLVLPKPNAPWKFAKILKFVSREVGRDYYKVEVIDADTALEYLSELLKQSAKSNFTFLIHGIDNSVEYALCSYSRIKKHTKSFVVPLLWNADRLAGLELITFIDTLYTMPLSGNALAQLYDSFFRKVKAQKNILCHSGGCLITHYFALAVSDYYQNMVVPGHFSNIFMVAAYVRYDMFNEWPEGSGEGKNLCTKDQWVDTFKYQYCRPGGGTAIVNMTDKVVVFWNDDDDILEIAENAISFLNDNSHLVAQSKQLGRYGDGTGPKNGVIPLDKFKNDVSFINVSPVDKTNKHEYHTDRFMIKYYDCYNQETVSDSECESN